MPDKPNTLSLERAVGLIQASSKLSDPWTGEDLTADNSPQEPGPTEAAMATILNAVVSGELTITHRQNIDSMEAGE